VSKRANPHERELATEVHYDFQRSRRWRLNYDLLWYVLYEQYKGNSEVFYDPPSGHRGAEVYKLPTAGPRPMRIRPLNNIGHAIDILTAKQMRPRPVWNVAPTSMEKADVLSARMAKDLLRHWWTDNSFTTRRRLLYLDRNIIGSAFMGCQWDSLGGPFESIPEMTTCPRCMGSRFDPEEMETANEGMVPVERPAACGQCEGAGNIVSSVKREPMGEVSFPFIRPWEVYPEPSATSLEDAEYLIRAYRVHPEVAQARFPWMPKDSIKESASLEEGESTFARLARDYRYEKPDGNAWIVEKHMAPLPGEEQPRVTILAGDRIVWPPPDDKDAAKEGWVRRPERTRKIPMVMFQARPNPEVFWPYGYAQDMISSNDTVNRGRHLQHQNMLMMAQPKWFVERGSVQADAITNQVAEVVEYDPGDKPPYSDRPAPLADWTERLVERENDRVYEIGMINDLDRGIPPKNIEAAEALEILAEQSGQAIGPVILQDNECWQQLGTAALHIAKANYKEGQKRFVMVGGEGSEAEAAALDAADLSTNLVINVTTGSALHQNLALKRNHLLAMWDKGIIKDSRELLAEMEFGIGVGDYNSDRRLQEDTAYVENEAIAQGEKHLVLAGTHDHHIHAMIHRRGALQAQTAGDLEGAQALTRAVMEHMMELAKTQQQPQKPGAGGKGKGQASPSQLPFDRKPPQGA
jgi:hypothetical protein